MDKNQLVISLKNVKENNLIYFTCQKALDFIANPKVIIKSTTSLMPIEYTREIMTRRLDNLKSQNRSIEGLSDFVTNLNNTESGIKLIYGGIGDESVAIYLDNKDSVIGVFIFKNKSDSTLE